MQHAIVLAVALIILRQQSRWPKWCHMLSIQDQQLKRILRLTTLLTWTRCRQQKILVLCTTSSRLWVWSIGSLPTNQLLRWMPPYGSQKEIISSSIVTSRYRRLMLLPLQMVLPQRRLKTSINIGKTRPLHLDHHFKTTISAVKRAWSSSIPRRIMSTSS